MNRRSFLGGAAALPLLPTAISLLPEVLTNTTVWRTNGVYISVAGADAYIKNLGGLYWQRSRSCCIKPNDTYYDPDTGECWTMTDNGQFAKIVSSDYTQSEHKS